MSRFAELVAKLKAKGMSNQEASGTAANIGRRKYGKKKFAAMCRKGKSQDGAFSLTHELMFDLQTVKQEQGLELGLGGVLHKAINTIKVHAPRIKKVVQSVAQSKISKLPKPAKNFFNRATSAGRAAYKVARTGGSTVKALGSTAWKNKNKLAVAGGAVAGIAALPNRNDSNPLLQSEPTQPAVKPLRYKVM